MVDVQFRQAAREDLAVTFIEPTSGRGAARARRAARRAPRRGLSRRAGDPALRATIAIARRCSASSRRASCTARSTAACSRSRCRRAAWCSPTTWPNEDPARAAGRHADRRGAGGQPPRCVEVPVLGITRQYLGVSAYMQQESLNALLREGDVGLGRLPRGRSRAPRPTSTPGCTRARACSAWSPTRRRSAASTPPSASSSCSTTWSPRCSPASIGFGVVYNSARIALSERGRELASLRVLGFTRGEIAYILLGELALLTLAAIPVGFWSWASGWSASWCWRSRATSTGCR